MVYDVIFFKLLNNYVFFIKYFSQKVNENRLFEKNFLGSNNSFKQLFDQTLI